MNFLAHLYLTDDFPEKVSVGNFMADSIKGRKAVEKYPEPIQKGIKIHRAIDDFTDSHPIFKKGTKRLHENYGKFAPVIMDVFYDYILASNWNKYHSENLESFCDNKYEMITRNKQYLPEKAQFIFKYMKRDNWLVSYQTLDGISSVLSRMDQRSKYLSGMSDSITELRKYEPQFIREFDLFFTEIQDFIQSEFY